MGISVLSLFDGISCGQVALRDAGIPVSYYAASEINESAIRVTQLNFPHTLHLGPVQCVDPTTLPPIDLMLGGSPCQSFSTAGRGAGFNGKSGLFYNFVSLLRSVQPRYFLFENVVMRKEWSDVITDELGVSPVLINSSSFVPQNRPRLYWTNIPLDISTLPTTPCAMTLSDIMFADVPESYYLTPTQLSKLDLNYVWSASPKSRIRKHKGGKHQQDAIQHFSGHAGCLAASHHGAARHLTKTLTPSGRVRRLTEIEVEQLQGLPVGYTEGISSSARYESIGNGWTVPVIEHILRGMAL